MQFNYENIHSHSKHYVITKNSATVNPSHYIIILFPSSFIFFFAASTSQPYSLSNPHWKMREIVHLQVGQCGNQVGGKVSLRIADVARQADLRLYLDQGFRNGSNRAQICHVMRYCICARPGAR